MCDLICPLCNGAIKTGQVRKEWWMSDIDKRVAHACCITAYEKGVVKGKSVVNADLEFAYKRSKVLADMLGIPVHESPEVTGTILGLVRGSVERLQRRNAEIEAAIVKTLNDNGYLADGDVCTLIDLKRAMPTWELE